MFQKREREREKINYANYLAIQIPYQISIAIQISSYQFRVSFEFSQIYFIENTIYI